MQSHTRKQLHLSSFNSLVSNFFDEITQNKPTKVGCKNPAMVSDVNISITQHLGRQESIWFVSLN